MLLVQTHQIKKNNKFYQQIDHLSFLSKNIYNYTNFLIRQEYTKTGKYLNYNNLRSQLVKSKQKDYYQLPCKVSNCILRQVDTEYKSFFKANKSYKNNPNKFLSKPKIPKYKHKKTGKNMIPYQKGTISKRMFKKQGVIQFSGTNIKIKTQIKDWNDIQAARIVPTVYGYKVQIIYHKQQKQLKQNDKVLGLDLGINNLVVGSTNINKQFVVNGRPLKAINQYYNKKKAKLYSQLSKQNKHSSKRLIKLTNKRNNKINDYLHRTSKRIIDYCLTNDISKIIIGHNIGWKQNINIGKINNQTFTQIPFNTLINQIKYKAKLNGIEVIITEQSYTSKCSFIDNESIQKHDQYLGKRVKRGLFKSNKGCLINADINGSLNIIRKVYPQFNVKQTLYYGLEGIPIYPVRLKV